MGSWGIRNSPKGLSKDHLFLPGFSNTILVALGLRISVLGCLSFPQKCPGAGFAMHRDAPLAAVIQITRRTNSCQALGSPTWILEGGWGTSMCQHLLLVVVSQNSQKFRGIKRRIKGDKPAFSYWSPHYLHTPPFRFLALLFSSLHLVAGSQPTFPWRSLVCHPFCETSLVEISACLIPPSL